MAACTNSDYMKNLLHTQRPMQFFFCENLGKTLIIYGRTARNDDICWRKQFFTDFIINLL